MASLNIKNEETYRLAQELAEQTGESMTTAVTEALRERLERVRQEQDVEERIKRALALTEGLGALWKEPWKSMDHGDFLYDERGLPK